MMDLSNDCECCSVIPDDNDCFGSLINNGHVRDGHNRVPDKARLRAVMYRLYARSGHAQSSRTVRRMTTGVNDVLEYGTVIPT